MSVRREPAPFAYGGWMSAEEAREQQQQQQQQQAQAQLRQTAQMNHPAHSYRQSMHSSRSEGVLDVDSIVDEQRHQQQLQQQRGPHTQSGRFIPVPALPLGQSLSRASDAQPRSAQPALRRPFSAHPSLRAQEDGSVAIPAVQYRPPSGTKLNKPPHTARMLNQIARDQEEARERLRAKAMDERIREAVAAQEQAAKSAHTLTGKLGRAFTQGTKSKRAPKSAKQIAEAKAARVRAAQLEQQTQAYLSPEQYEAIQQPYQTQYKHAPQGPQSTAATVIYQTGAQPAPTAHEFVTQQQQHQQQQSPPATVTSFSQTVRPLGQWGPTFEPADRKGQPVSRSTQSRLSAQALEAQPVAGKPSGNTGWGSDLTGILGGGHAEAQDSAFARPNAPSAQTRVQVGEKGVVPNKHLYADSTSSSRAASRYAPFATSSPLQLQSTPASRLFNDDAGALVVRDSLTDDVRHAPAAIGFGRSHSGYKEFVLRAASASMTGQEERPRQVDPSRTGGNTNLLSWSTSDSKPHESHKERLARKQREAWARTQGDRGGPATGDHTQLAWEEMPVAGAPRRTHEPLRLSYPEHELPAAAALEAARASSRAQASMRRSMGGARTHVHGPGCGHASATLSSSASTPQLSATNSSPQRYGASALGYGRKHDAYKTVILAAASGRPLPSEE